MYHFLDSTYKKYHMIFICLSLAYFTEYDNLCVHLCCWKWHYFILFYGWVVFHYIYVPQFYPLSTHLLMDIWVASTNMDLRQIEIPTTIHLQRKGFKMTRFFVKYLFFTLFFLFSPNRHFLLCSLMFHPRHIFIPYSNLPFIVCELLK